uniref:Uncharacterized protein TCIL3000_5_4080 n=1 Tax=Trypanosoma congolense (strain IL3000) TaxID=1068625 RepID=G0ULZ9_TRYCI|nr:unnamed protein product [Trypanosoma congolense IL3000]
MLQEWGVVRSAGDSPPPRFPNFSKFLDGPEGLRVRSSSPHVLGVGQPLKERVSSARGCHDLVTLGSPGSSPTATASLGLSRRERSDRSPPRSYTNFSESRLVESNVRRRLGSQSGLQPAESKAMAGPSCYQRSSRAGCTRPSLGKGSRPITNSRTSVADGATGANMYDSSCDGRRGSHPRRMNLGWTWDILDVNNNLKGRKWFKNAMAVTRNNAKLSHLTLLRTPISDATASGKVREAFCGRTLKTPQGSRKDDQAGVKNPDPSGPSVSKEAPIARRLGNRIGAQSPHRVLAPAAPSVSSELQGGVSPSTCAASILRSRSDPKSSPKSSRRGRHASMDRRQWASVTGDHETSPGPSVRCVLYSKLVSEDDGSCRGSALGADTKPTKGRAKRRHCKASSVSVPAVIHVARERRVSNVSKKEVYPTRKIIPSTKPP